jgi:hypothetical protein
MPIYIYIYMYIYISELEVLLPLNPQKGSFFINYLHLLSMQVYKTHDMSAGFQFSKV